MASKYETSLLSFWIVMLVITVYLERQTFIEGLQTIDKRNFNPKPEGTIKTIEDPEVGDLIDCVDIYKQPALKNPLIKDKTIQMKPSSRFLRDFNITKNPSRKIIQNWHKYGKCPKGTVPITRSLNFNGTLPNKSRNNDNYTHEYVEGKTMEGRYYGASAIFNVWNPNVSSYTEFSLSQMWILSGMGTPGLNSLEAGWIVYPFKFGGSLTRLFTFWTIDNHNTICYNYDCGGFMHTNNRIRLGDPIYSVSVFGNPFLQEDKFIAMGQDKEGDGRWWLVVDRQEVGYFPASIFTRLQNGVEEIGFGGEIINERKNNQHTRTEMGSGHFSSLLLGGASYIRNMRVIDHQYRFIDADISQRLGITNPNCYDYTPGENNPTYGSHFYFGGPGYNERCP